MLATLATAVHQIPLATAQSPQLQQETRVPTLRGDGRNREMLLRGRVLGTDGKQTEGFELSVNIKNQYTRDSLTVIRHAGQFEVWVPIGSSHWFYVEFIAKARDGLSRVFTRISNRELRRAAIEGLDLRLVSADRAVKVFVTHDGVAVPNAYVAAELQNNRLGGKTDASGQASLLLTEGEKLSQLTAWTEDFRIGGFSFHRKPRRDPLDTEFTIELDNCRDQRVRLLDVEDDSPIPGVAFNLIIGTGKPNYNFAATPSSFPHCRLMTDQSGEATCHWFPDWETHGAYVDIVDARWAQAQRNDEMETAADGALIMKLRRRAHRKPFVGRVTSEHFDVAGLLVEIRSFQGENEGYGDALHVYTNEDGTFTADCIPGATYCVCVNDALLTSNIVDLIPYEPDTGKSNRASLYVAEGEPVEIRVSAGSNRIPLPNQAVYLRSVHSYTWIEDGEKRKGNGGRAWWVYTDDDGVARVKALVGSELQASVNAGEWRSGQKTVTVKENAVTVLDFHREVVTERKVEGRLLAPPNTDVKVASAEVVLGSIDGETDEQQSVVTDEQGYFSFQTKAIRFGIFAYTSDGRAAGIAKPVYRGQPIELHLKPTVDLRGQLLGDKDKPLTNHAVRVTPRVRGKRDFNRGFGTSFAVRTFEARTDGDGNYTLRNLPSELAMTLRADPIDSSDHDATLDDFFLVANSKRPRMVSRLYTTPRSDEQSLAKKYSTVLRDATLGDFHVLVIIYDSTADNFVGRYLMDRERTKEVISFLNLRIREGEVADDVSRRFVDSKVWPQPERGKVFLAALDGSGRELGRIELDLRARNSSVRAADFIVDHAPAQSDAERKWAAAFAEAKRSGRQVWARIGQRYCGPCFRLSRWLDDNRELLERDYVFLKIDNVRDKDGAKVADRIVSGREHFGVPFHAIFDSSESLLIDSEGPTGNIGHPASYEGRLHLTRMLKQTRKNLTGIEVDRIVSTLE